MTLTFSKKMKPETKLQVYIFCYALILWMTNWSLAHTYDRTTGLASTSRNMQGFGILFSLIVVYILAKRVWKILRVLLDRRIRVPRSLKLWGDWKPLLLLLPLFIGITHHSHGIADDGAAIHTVFEYGGDSSIALFFFGAVAIMLFQLLVRLESFDPDHQGESGRREILTPAPHTTGHTGLPSAMRR